MDHYCKRTNKDIITWTTQLILKAVPCEYIPEQSSLNNDQEELHEVLEGWIDSISHIIAALNQTSTKQIEWTIIDFN